MIRLTPLLSGCAESLELVRPSGPLTIKVGGSNKGDRPPPRCLFELLNRTRTTCGSRLLRATLLQPLTDIPTLEMRYDCVEEIMEDENLANNVIQVTA